MHIYKPGNVTNEDVLWLDGNQRCRLRRMHSLACQEVAAGLISSATFLAQQRWSDATDCSRQQVARNILKPMFNMAKLWPFQIQEIAGAGGVDKGWRIRGLLNNLYSSKETWVLSKSNVLLHCQEYDRKRLWSDASQRDFYTASTGDKGISMGTNGALWRWLSVHFMWL